MDVSIIVVAWNVHDFVFNCLKSVYKETKGIEFEVIYVDNGSEDGSVQMVRKEFPHVRVIENNENKGFIKANNQGIEIAQGRYVLLLNSDTIILDNAIAKTLLFADEHQDAAVVGCKVLNPDGTLQRSCFMYPSILNMFLYATHLYKVFPNSKFFGREKMTWWDFSNVSQVETIKGCFSLVRKEAIEQVGLMDNIYFVFGDDIDWCYRFRKSGWKIMFVPDPKIIHYGGQTTKLMANTFTLQLYGSILIFMKKHRTQLSFTIACLLIALYFFLRVPYWTAIGIFNKKESNRAFLNVRTYLKGSLFALLGWKNLLMNKEMVESSGL